ncbi:MAG TPA: hypothetical protein VLI06_21125 [Solimonas sp.]|nr:hypothetical protein [Solimonas sp.]
MNISRTRGLTAMLAALLLPACGGDYEGGDLPGDAGGGVDLPQPRIESIQTQVFDRHCISCHAGNNPSGAMGLDDAQTSHDNLVGVRAAEFPLRFRVQPGNPDDSYLVHKLEGSQAVGARMPQGGAPLSPDLIAAIRQWIADGAPGPGEGTLLP